MRQHALHVVTAVALCPGMWAPAGAQSSLPRAPGAQQRIQVAFAGECDQRLILKLQIAVE